MVLGRRAGHHGPQPGRDLGVEGRLLTMTCSAQNRFDQSSGEL